MLAKRAGDEIDGELVARGYYRMLGHLSEKEMSALTEMVLERCKWFPTVAECREIMSERSYSNPFYNARRIADLRNNGYLTSNERDNLELEGGSVRMLPGKNGD